MPSPSTYDGSSDRIGMMATAAFDWTAFDAYLFDIDGTLLNARGGVHYNSFHNALREVYGSSGRIDSVPVHGNTDIGILRAALEYHGHLPADFEARIPTARAMMCEEVERNWAEMQVELCPGIERLLCFLLGRGKLLGVVTGNFERIAWRKLENAGVRHFFKVGAFSDHHEKREEIFRQGIKQVRNVLGSNAKICIVGDTPNDIRAAEHLGIPVIAVATGIYSCEVLSESSPTLCVASCSDLLASAESTPRQPVGL